MNEYYFEYRGGEIVATVKACTLLEALRKFDKKVDISYRIELNTLWPDFWTYEGDELSIVLEVENYRIWEENEQDI